jgi:hypothetical protein
MAYLELFQKYSKSVDLGKLEYFLVSHNTWNVANGSAAVWSRLGNSQA